MASELCGQAAFTERVRITGGQAHHEDRRVWHDVLTPDMIRQLPARHALVIQGGYAPVIIRLAAAWNDPRLHVRPPFRHGRRLARPGAAPGPARTHPDGRTGQAGRPGPSAGPGCRADP